jgi:putative inorganic carbon (HCO3(-)) transporter
MALLLTLLSIALSYFSPEEIVPAWAPYHIQQFIIGGALFISVFFFDVNRGGIRSMQSILVVGFWFAVVVSVLSKGWFGASLTNFTNFGVIVAIYFLVSLNAFTLKRIKILCGVISLCSIVMGIEGIMAFHNGFDQEKLMIGDRIRGYGVLGDPNDFAQFLLIGMAFLGMWWRKRKKFRNLVLVLVPASVFTYAIYLTSSRGAMFGMVAIVFVVSAKRMNKGLALLMAAGIFAILIAAHFGGGREISLSEGSAAGRVIAWGSGIDQLKHHPLFGTGFGEFTNYNDLTAHNSFVLCFAELGFFGYFFWMALLITTILGLEALAKAPPAKPSNKTLDDVDFLRCVTVVRAALYTFLATGWFLSRTYQDTLYIILALAAVLICMRRNQIPSPIIPAGRLVPMTVIYMLMSIIAIYGSIKLRLV